MAPRRLLQGVYALQRHDNSTSSELQSQWVNPADILSFLLIIGGDVVQRALAQNSGDLLPCPVVFSFGWVAYAFAFTGLLSAVDDTILLPPPDFQIIVASTSYGHQRSNQSWILGRVMRDFEKTWMPEKVDRELQVMLRQIPKDTNQHLRTKAGLCVSTFDAVEDPEAGTSYRDLYWYSSYAIALLQLCISIIPWAIWGQWQDFAITTFGTFLAFATGSLAQWRRERWACRRNSKKTFINTR